MAKYRKKGWRYWLRLVLTGLLGGPLLGYIIFTAYMIEVESRPVNRTVCCLTPEDFGLEYREITLAGAENIQLAGWYIPSENGGAIILVHGYGGSRVELIRQAAFLAQAGYGVLMVDLRGHGESTPVRRSYGWQDTADMPSLVDFLLDQPDVDPESIGIFGFSIGGQIAIRYTSKDTRISAIIAEDPSHVSVFDAPLPQSPGEHFTYFLMGLYDQLFSWRVGISIPEGVVSSIQNIPPRPIFFISSEVGSFLTENYFQLASEPKDFWLVPDTRHGGVFNTQPEEYTQHILDFFEQHLLSD